MRIDSQTLLAVLALLAAAHCQAFYNPPPSNAGSSNSITRDNLLHVCLCDITTGMCDIDCSCDPECANRASFAGKFGFKFDNNVVGINDECYNTTSGVLWTVNEKFGLEKRENGDEVCTYVTSQSVLDDFIPTTSTLPSTPGTATTLQQQTLAPVKVKSKTQEGYEIGDSLLFGKSEFFGRHV